MTSDPSPLLLLSVGNTRTRAATVLEGKLQPSKVIPNRDASGADSSSQLLEAVRALAPQDATVVLASVNDQVADQVASLFQGNSGIQVRRVIRVVAPGSAGLPVPIRCDLTPPITTGVDRLLNALAAYARSGEACTVIDAGTAVTVDFVDRWGVFQGGCIAPGLATGLRALHNQTASLPLLDAAALRTLPTAPGKTTADAMLAGCAASIRGMVHHLVEKYAEISGAYPRVIATGGDAPVLFENDDIVEHIVPDLTLMGLLATWEGGEIGAPPTASPRPV